jgi:conjugative transposon TraM protein
MEKIVHSPRFLRQRKFMLVLPVIALPFIIILFVLLGGGKGTGGMNHSHAAGLNTNVPDAHIKKGKDKSKLLLYDEASRDSVIRQEKIKNDPYYIREPQDSAGVSTSSRSDIDQNESRIMEKLEKLKLVIHQKPETAESKETPISLQRSTANRELIEKLMSNTPASQKPPANHNPEIDQLNGMLDKVLAIQHPEIMSDSLNRVAQSQHQAAYHVDLNKPSTDAETFGLSASDENSPAFINRFYDLANEETIENERDNTIEAIIPETQMVYSGSTIKLKVLNDVRINGHFIPKDQFIYGIASLSNERMKIQFSSIRSGSNILPVSLEAFDLDGLTGISIPGSMNRDVAKQSGDQAIGALGLTTLDPSLGAQAAGASIQAAKSLISRKVKLVKVTIKAGYRVLLKDSK